MDRTLLTPPMIETFRVCKRAYQFAFMDQEKVESINSICKRFLLKALAEINSGKIVNVNHLQKYLGQHWPADKLKADDGVKAFLFIYKALISYLANPYKPDGAELVAVGLKIRSRLPHERVYLEDTFDLIFWHPKQKVLEFVDFHIQPLKALNQAWPTPSILVKQFLAERLHTRWPYKELMMTFVKVGVAGITPTAIKLDQALYRLHWAELLKTVDEMKDPDNFSPTFGESCKRCEFATPCSVMQRRETAKLISRSA